MSIIHSMDHLRKSVHIMAQSVEDAVREVRRGRDTAKFAVERATDARLFIQAEEDAFNEVGAPEKLRHVTQATQNTVDVLLASKDMQVDYAITWLNHALTYEQHAYDLQDAAINLIADWRAKQRDSGVVPDSNERQLISSELLITLESISRIRALVMDARNIVKQLPERGDTPRVGEPTKAALESIQRIVDAARELVHVRGK